MLLVNVLDVVNTGCDRNVSEQSASQAALALQLDSVHLSSCEHSTETTLRPFLGVVLVQSQKSSGENC